MGTYEHSIYPVRGVAPVPTEQGNIFLHAAVRWHDGTKQSLGMLTAPGLVEPDFPIPIERYVRVPVARDGTVNKNWIEVARPAALSELDRELLEAATGELGMRCGYMSRMDQPGAGVISLNPEEIDYTVVHEGDKLTYRVDSSGLILAHVRALAMHNLVEFLAVRN